MNRQRTEALPTGTKNSNRDGKLRPCFLMPNYECRLPYFSSSTRAMMSMASSSRGLVWLAM